MTKVSSWLRGPVEGVPLALQPSAHALIDAGESLVEAAGRLSVDELWITPGGAASVGFHLRHIAGSTDRLVTYSRGEMLDEAAQRVLSLEKEPGTPAEDPAYLLADVLAAIERTLDVYRRTDPETLAEPRFIGRGRLPSTVLGALAHVADHMQRHTGQVITTAKIIRGLGPGLVMNHGRPRKATE